MTAPRAKCAPYLCCRDAVRALEFYEKAFGAEVLARYVDHDGRLGHGELAVNGAVIYVSDEWPEGGVFSPAKYGGTSVAIQLAVADVDAFVARAVSAGATLERAVADQPYGDRSGIVRDPYGHRWFIATPVEELSKAELRARMGDSYLID
jgi:uncharacterized glyoxalase superfamily protein PhnB